MIASPTTYSAPLTALAVTIAGQDLAAAPTALAALRGRPADIRLVAVCIGGANPLTELPFDRVIHLPMGPEHGRLAEAIGLQICFNEGASVAGTLRRLDARTVEDALQHCALLRAAKADAVVVPGDGAAEVSLFLGLRAAFLASAWGALRDEQPVWRLRIASALLGLAGRRAAVFRGPGAGYAWLEASTPESLAARAEALRRKLGLFLGPIRPPPVQPVRSVAVVTPYYKEPDAELSRMLDSVAGQTLRCHHILVSDGFPSDLARRAGVTHVALGAAHGDNGNTPRYVGALVALAHGHDAVAFLDADNWFEPQHVERLVECQHRSGAAAVFSFRNVYLPDGSKVEAEDEEDAGRNHVDTSCMMITRDCEYAMHLWGQMPQEWSPACDRVVYAELNGQRLAWTGERSLNFKSHYPLHYQLAGRPIPPDVHAVPEHVFVALVASPPEARDRSISRTGRVISLGRR